MSMWGLPSASEQRLGSKHGGAKDAHRRQPQPGRWMGAYIGHKREITAITHGPLLEEAASSSSSSSSCSSFGRSALGCVASAPAATPLIASGDADGWVHVWYMTPASSALSAAECDAVPVARWRHHYCSVVSIAVVRTPPRRLADRATVDLLPATKAALETLTPSVEALIDDAPRTRAVVESPNKASGNGTTLLRSRSQSSLVNSSGKKQAKILPPSPAKRRRPNGSGASERRRRLRSERRRRRSAFAASTPVPWGRSRRYPSPPLPTSEPYLPSRAALSTLR